MTFIFLKNSLEVSPNVYMFDTVLFFILGEDLMSSGDVLESPDSPEHQPQPLPVQDPVVPDTTETAMDSNPGSPVEDTGTGECRDARWCSGNEAWWTHTVCFLLV